MNEKRTLHTMRVLAGYVRAKVKADKPQWAERQQVAEHRLAYMILVFNDHLRKKGDPRRYWFDWESCSLRCES